MSENKQFKIGDEAWYFTFPEDGCGGFDIEQIELNELIIDEFIINQPFIKHAFPSKISGISAMLEKLGELGSNQ